MDPYCDLCTGIKRKRNLLRRIWYDSDEEDGINNAFPYRCEAHDGQTIVKIYFIDCTKCTEIYNTIVEYLENIPISVQIYDEPNHICNYCDCKKFIESFVYWDLDIDGDEIPINLNHAYDNYDEQQLLDTVRRQFCNRTKSARNR